MRKINEIIIHCTATEAHADYSVNDVDKWHRARGFTSCGYHYLIHIDGTIEAARALQEVGAHCLGHNLASVGIAYVGGLVNGIPTDTRTANQKAAFILLIKQLAGRFSIVRVVGHNHYANKACPCFQAQVEYSYLVGKKYLEFI